MNSDLFKPKFGILDLGYNIRRPSSETINKTFESVMLAEELGYTRYWLAEHHNLNLAWSSPEILVGLLAGLTKSIRVGPAGIILRYYKITNKLNTYFSKYYAFQKRVKAISINNGIAYVQYEPEIERYAGPFALKIAEDQFALSSKTVLKFLKKYGSVKKLEVALKLHLAFALSMNLTHKEIKVLFFSLFNTWLPITCNFKFGSKINDLNERILIENEFAILFKKQENDLKDFHSEFIRCVRNSLIKESSLQEWYIGNKEFHKRLVELKKRGEYIVPKWATLVSYQELTTNTKELFFVYKSLIHMTNNRIGIHVSEESYLAYIIYRSIEALDSEHEPTNI